MTKIAEHLPRVRSKTNCIPRAKGRSCSSTDLRKEERVTIYIYPIVSNPSGTFPPTASDTGGLSPECDDDGRGLGTGGDEGDDEEEDQEGDECVARAVALPRHGVAVLVQVGLDDDQLQLVDLAAGGRGDDLPALHAAAVSVVPDLLSNTTHTQ